jgi:hypothetical protein
VLERGGVVVGERRGREEGVLRLRSRVHRVRVQAHIAEGDTCSPVGARARGPPRFQTPPRRLAPSDRRAATSMTRGPGLHMNHLSDHPHGGLQNPAMRLSPFSSLQRHPCRSTAKWRAFRIPLDPEESRGSSIGDVERGPRDGRSSAPG